jgi:hypothetical protein
MIYDKRRKKPTIRVSAKDIQVFEIIYRENESEYDSCRLFSNDQEIVTFGGWVVPLEELLNFCKHNGIEPLIFTISWSVFFVSIKPKQLIIQYYAKDRKDKKIGTNDIARIELEILHPISDSLNRYVVYTNTNERFEFEYHAVDSKKLGAYAQEHNIPLIETKLY